MCSSSECTWHVCSSPEGGPEVELCLGPVRCMQLAGEPQGRLRMLSTLHDFMWRGRSPCLHDSCWGNVLVPGAGVPAEPDVLATLLTSLWLL